MFVQKNKVCFHQVKKVENEDMKLFPNSWQVLQIWGIFRILKLHGSWDVNSFRKHYFQNFHHQPLNPWKKGCPPLFTAIKKFATVENRSENYQSMAWSYFKREWKLGFKTPLRFEFGFKKWVLKTTNVEMIC